MCAGQPRARAYVYASVYTCTCVCVCEYVRVHAFMHAHVRACVYADCEVRRKELWWRRGGEGTKQEKEVLYAWGERAFCRGGVKATVVGTPVSSLGWALVRLVGIGTFVSLYYYYTLYIYTCRTRDVDVPTNCAARIKISDYH